MPIDPKMFNALGGGQPAQVPQPAAPAPAGSPASGAGPSLFQALGEQPMHQMGAQPLMLGPQVADSSDTGLMHGNPFYQQQAAPQPDEKPIYNKRPPQQHLTDAEIVQQSMQHPNRKH